MLMSMFEMNTLLLCVLFVLWVAGACHKLVFEDTVNNNLRYNKARVGIPLHKPYTSLAHCFHHFWGPALRRPGPFHILDG